MCDDGRLRDIERFLANEARLLDAMQYDEWLATLSADITYRVPLRRSRRVGGARTGFSTAWPGENGELAFMLFDDDLDSLRLRVERLQTGLAHGEVPPSATQRMVGGIVVTQVEPDSAGADTYEVYSGFTLTQVRHDRNADEFIGHRHDLIRWDGEPKLAKRTVHLVQSVLPRAISIFF